MKLKVFLSISSVILLIMIACFAYYMLNYKTIDEAIKESNVPIDEIFYTTDRNGHTIIMFSKDDVLSVGLIEKTFFGYHWGLGSGSEQFNEENQILTRMFSNLHPRNTDSEDELVSLTFGVIYDDQIEKLMIKYKDQAVTEATILETSKGRIWFSFSNSPINYDPEVTRIYKDGSEISGWY